MIAKRNASIEMNSGMGSRRTGACEKSVVWVIMRT